MRVRLTANLATYHTKGMICIVTDIGVDKEWDPKFAIKRAGTDFSMVYPAGLAHWLELAE